jgi:hypothetical protein
MSELIELSRWRDNDGLVRVNHAALMRKLALRGKVPAALREARVSYETLAKVKRGQPNQRASIRKIVVQLAKWPELEHAVDLLDAPHQRPQ